MPFRMARDALSFDGIPLHLNRYFSDVEYLHRILGLHPTDEDLIQVSIYYLDHETSMLWESLLNPLVPVTWNQFKNLIAGLYPGADGAHLYSM
jgi:hypothetical protein